MTAQQGRSYGVMGLNPAEIMMKNFYVSFSQCFPHVSSVVVQCRSVYANFWQLID